MMFINCKKTVKIPTESGDFVKFSAGFVGNCPESLKSHWYFKALCDDGTITFYENSKDETAEEAAKESSDKAAETERKAERQRIIDDVKNAAKIEAENEAKEKGLTAPETKALVKERQKAAVQAAIADIEADKNEAKE
jgi:hypothetical protein